jgi:histidinol phosphatase-like PHP family hydrolase
MDIVNRARKAGVNIPFLGSDAHLPQQIGLDFEAAVAVVPPSLPGFED